MITVRLTAGAAIVASLDDPGLFPRLRIRCLRSVTVVEGEPEALAELARTLEGRAAGGWDQPSAWVHSARVNARRLRDALRAGRAS